MRAQDKVSVGEAGWMEVARIGDLPPDLGLALDPALAGPDQAGDYLATTLSRSGSAAEASVVSTVPLLNQ